MGIKRFFDGGMNRDVAYELLGAGSYPLARNLVKGRTTTGKGGAFEPMLGTVAVDLGSITENGHKCIGMCAYDPDNTLFMMFWHSDTAKHKIIRYSPDGVNVPFKNAEISGATIVAPGDLTALLSALDVVIFQSRYYNKSVSTSISTISYSAVTDKTTIVLAGTTGITSLNVDGVIRNVTKKYANVITSPLLGFTESKLILNAKYVGGYLYFVDDGGDDARAIDVYRWAGSFTGGKEDIFLSKRTSAHAPEWEAFDASPVDGEIAPDLLVGYDFQFAVQYVYENGMTSVVSAHSTLAPSPVSGEKRFRVRLPIPSSMVAAPVTDGITLEVVSGYDAPVKIVPETELVPETVSKIVFLSRVGNGGAWYIIDTVKRNASKEFERNWTDFYNNEAGAVISSRYSVPFDIVPIKPKAIELAKNRIFLGNFFEGYDSPATDISGMVSKTLVSGTGNLLFDTAVTVLSVGFIRQMGPGVGTNWRQVGEHIRFGVRLSDDSYRFIDDTAIRTAVPTAREIEYDGSVSPPRIRISGDVTVAIQPGDVVYADLPITDWGEPTHTLDYGFYVKSLIGFDGSWTTFETEFLAGGVPYNSTYSVTAGSPVDLFTVDPVALLVDGALLESAPVSPEFYNTNLTSRPEGDFDLGGEFDVNDTRFGGVGGIMPTIEVESDLGVEALAGLTSFGTNSSYRIGVVYKDWSLRAAGASPGGSVDIASDEYVFNANIQWMISDDANIPDWADYYSIVMSKNLRKTRFLEYHTGNIYYLDELGASTYDYADSNSATVVDLRNMKAAGKAYNFVPGDRIILYGVNDVAGAIYDLPIKSVDGDDIILENKDFGSATLTTEQAIRFEIYSPVFEGFDSLLYEVGQTYKIDRSGPSPVHSVKSGLLPGDSINVLRPMYILSAGVVTPDAVTPVNIYRAISSQDADPTAVWNTSSGFPFAVDDIGQVLKDQYFRYSGPFIQDTRVNGLNEFDALNEEAMPAENGPIIGMRLAAKAQVDGSVMIVVGRFNPASVYLGETQFLDNEGQAVTALSREVIGTVNSQVNEKGCDSPESIFQMKGRVYWYHKDRNEFIRYTEGGAADISTGAMLSHFRKVSGSVLTMYDPFYDILISAAGSQSDGAEFRTVGFDLAMDEWRGYYGFQPDMGTHLLSNLYTTSGKNLYRHDDSSAKYCEFYGVAKAAEVWMSFNDAPDTPKEWTAISLKVSPSLIDFSAPEPVFKDVDLTVTFENPNGQATDLIYTDFNIDEYVAYAPLYFDTLSSGGLMNGDEMVSASILAKLSIKEDYLFQLYFFEMGVRESTGHNL